MKLLRIKATGLPLFKKELVMTFFGQQRVDEEDRDSLFLDVFKRNDCIFITRNRNGISVENLADILKRNDLKKSDAYQSGFLDGTVPGYEDYLKLKKKIQSALTKEED